MGGGPSNVTSTTTSQLPPWAQPVAAYLLGNTENYVNADLQNGMPAGLNSQVAPLSGAQNQGLQSGLSAAAGAGALLNPALAQMENTLSGAMLNPASNPYLQATFEAAAQPLVTQYQDATEPGIQAEFAHAGSFGGSAQQQTEGIAQQELGNALANLGTGIYGNAYQQGLQNQIREQALLPGLLGASFAPAQEELALGGLQQAQNQAQLNANQQNAQLQYQYPFQTLDQLASVLPPAVGGSYLGSSSMTNPNAITPLTGTLAGGLGGYGLGSLIGAPLLGAAAGPLGAGLGGLAGLLAGLL